MYMMSQNFSEKFNTYNKSKNPTLNVNIPCLRELNNKRPTPTFKKTRSRCSLLTKQWKYLQIKTNVVIVLIESQLQFTPKVPFCTQLPTAKL